MRMFLAAVMVVGTVHPAFAEIGGNGSFTIVDEVLAHGGGCRKSSPKGQCCHAGKQKQHCHKKETTGKTSKTPLKK